MSFSAVMPFPITRLMIVFAAFAVALASAAMLPREYRAAMLGQRGPAGQVEQVLTDPHTGPVHPARSLRGQRAQLEACDRALRGPFAALQTDDRRARLARRCADLAGAILARAPTLGLAHLVRAEAALARADPSGFSQAITLARRTAPAEGWLAARRLDLALPVWADLSEMARRAVGADAALLIAAPRYRGAMAQRWHTDPPIRRVLALAAGTLPPGAQRAFLHAVKGAGEGAGR